MNDEIANKIQPAVEPSSAKYEEQKLESLIDELDITVKRLLDEASDISNCNAVLLNCGGDGNLDVQKPEENPKPKEEPQPEKDQSLAM